MSSKFLVISNSFANFLTKLFLSTYEFEIDFKLTQISNSAIGDRVWAPWHIETSSKGHYPIQNTLYSIGTRNFWSSFRIFMTFPCNKWPMRGCHMLSHWWLYINFLSSRFFGEKSRSWIFSESLTFCGEEDENFSLFSFILYWIYCF